MMSFTSGQAATMSADCISYKEFPNFQPAMKISRIFFSGGGGGGRRGAAGRGWGVGGWEGGGGQRGLIYLLAFVACAIHYRLNVET